MKVSSVNPYLVSHDQLPSWCHDNPDIITGYRRVGGSNKKSEDQAVDSNGHSATSSISKRTRGKARKASSSQKEAEHMDTADSDEYEVNTFYKCWRSIWDYWHNETVNIHTHLWGAVVSLLMFILHTLNHFSIFPTLFDYIKPLTHSSIFLPPVLKPGSSSIPGLSAIYALDIVNPVVRNPEWKDTLGFSIFLLSAVCCLGLSAIFHTCTCYSQKISKQLNQGDYVGIVVLITGSFIPAVHYGFYCQPRFQLFYTCSISILGAAAIYTVVNPLYSTSSYRPLRTSIFISLGLSAIFPITHLTFTLGLSKLNHTMGLNYLVLSGALYISGALIYANRIPEKLYPGRFDYLGASHQIFHVFILLAAFSHYVALRRAYNFWHAITLTGGQIPQSLSEGWFGAILGGKKVEERMAEVSRQAVCFALDSLRG